MQKECGFEAAETPFLKNRGTYDFSFHVLKHEVGVCAWGRGDKKKIQITSISGFLFPLTHKHTHRHLPLLYVNTDTLSCLSSPQSVVSKEANKAEGQKVMH